MHTAGKLVFSYFQVTLISNFLVETGNNLASIANNY